MRCVLDRPQPLITLYRHACPLPFGTLWSLSLAPEPRVRSQRPSRGGWCQPAHCAATWPSPDRALPEAFVAVPTRLRT